MHLPVSRERPNTTTDMIRVLDANLDPRAAEAARPRASALVARDARIDTQTVDLRANAKHVVGRGDAGPRSCAGDADFRSPTGFVSSVPVFIIEPSLAGTRGHGSALMT